VEVEVCADEPASTVVPRAGALNEADPLSRRPNFVPHAIVPLVWDGEVPPDTELRRKSMPLFKDAQLNSMTDNALQLSHGLADLNCEGDFLFYNR
jgi:hypothetical protein